MCIQWWTLNSCNLAHIQTLIQIQQIKLELKLEWYPQPMENQKVPVCSGNEVMNGLVLWQRERTFVKPNIIFPWKVLREVILQHCLNWQLISPPSYCLYFPFASLFVWVWVIKIHLNQSRVSLISCLLIVEPISKTGIWLRLRYDHTFKPAYTFIYIC